jgi:hypothetical protein
MRRALVVGWGDLGGRVADTWERFNHDYFGGRLRPLPIFLTPTTPYGHLVGWTCCGGAVTHIALAAPKDGHVLVAGRGCLLHEMVHQALHEAGEDIRHKGEPWCREIMRLHRLITGEEIWAGASVVRKVRDADGVRRSKRYNQPHPETGAPGLGQRDIAGWPGSAGIRLGYY